MVSWVVTPHSLANRYQYFRELASPASFYHKYGGSWFLRNVGAYIPTAKPPIQEDRNLSSQT
jgi:hypothetical protein